jgi:hypothetical protein
MKKKYAQPELGSLMNLSTMVLMTVLLVLYEPQDACGQIDSHEPNAATTSIDQQKALASDLVFGQEGGMSPTRRKMMDDALAEPRKIAAAIVAAEFPAPQFVVQVGAFQGEFLEVFLDRFPGAHGQWTEAITSEHNLPATKQRFARFGDRVDFAFGCARRDLSAGCVLPKETDVILLEWLSIQQNLDGMYKVYRAGAAQLPQGGWIINVDHVRFGGNGWEPIVQTAVKEFRHPEVEGPPIHYPQFQIPTVDEQLSAMREAGFDAQVVWQSFSTVLFMGRKK